MKKLRGVILIQIVLIVLLTNLFAIPAYAEKTIELNGKLTGKLSKTFDSDIYKLIIPEDGKMQFVVVPDSSLSASLILYGENGTNLISDNLWSDKGKTISLVDMLMEGTYYIKVRSDSSYGSYTLSTTFTKESKENDAEPNNSFLDAVSIELNSSVTGHLGFIDSKGITDESDWYKLIIPEDGKMQFVVAPDPSLSTSLILYGENGTNLISDNLWSDKGKTISLVDMLMEGTYYIKVRSDSSYGSYTLSTTFTKESKENDAEPNDSFLDAVSIELNSSVTGHLGFIGSKGITDERDWYKLVIPEEGKMQFIVVPSSNLETTLSLYGEDGVTLIRNNIWGGKGQTRSIEIQLMPGTYYFKVVGFSGYGSYTLLNTFSSSVKHNKIVLTIGKPNMVFNSQTKEIDPGRGTSPIIINGRTLVPIRTIIETMGGTVGWNDSERKISIVHGATSIDLWLGKKEAIINNSSKRLDVEPVSINGRTMVPLRFVIENLNCDVKWDDSTKTVTIEF